MLEWELEWALKGSQHVQFLIAIEYSEKDLFLDYAAANGGFQNACKIRGRRMQRNMWVGIES